MLHFAVIRHAVITKPATLERGSYVMSPRYFAKLVHDVDLSEAIE